MRQRSDNKNGWVRKLWQVYTIILTNSFKEALCAPVFIFTSGSSALLGRPRCCLSIWLSLLAIFNIPFWVYVNLFHEKTDKTRKYVRKALILRASLKPLWFGSILEWAQAIVILGLLTFQVDWNTFSVTTVSRYIYKQSSPSPPEKKPRSNSTFSPSPFSLPSVWLLQFILFQKKNWSVRVMWNCWETEKTCSWNTLMAMQDENCRHFMRFKRFLFC